MQRRHWRIRETGHVGREYRQIRPFLCLRVYTCAHAG